MQAIIVGSGIAGTVAAIALQRAGIRATVYERASAGVCEEGLFLTLAPNGLRVLEKLGLMKALLKADVVPTPNMVFLNSNARRIASVSMGSPESDIKPVTLRRKTLYAVLASEARQRGIGIVYGAPVIEYRNTVEVSSVLFADGTERHCDVVIGADGIHSVIRRQMHTFDDLTLYTGLINVGGIVEQSGLLPTAGEFHMIWARRAFFGYTVRENGQAWWFANLGRASEPIRQCIKDRSVCEWNVELLETFKDEPQFVSDLIRATPLVSAFPIYDVPTVPRWVDGRTVLIGDAAHAISPSSGQGASLAIEDAACLAVCLRDIDDPVAALTHFEVLRRSRVERIVAEGRRRGMYKAPASALIRHIRDLLLPIALKLFGSDRAQSWIYDYHVPEKIRLG